MKKKFIVKISVLIVSVLLSLLFAEWVLRLVPNDFLHYESALVGDSLLGIPPTNTDPSKDFPQKNKPEDVYRILVLGDSHTVSVSSDQSYPEVLEKLLNDSDVGNKRIEVHNAGAPGHSHFQHYLSYTERFKEFEPDLVVVGFYLGNDFLDLFRNDDRPSLSISEDGFIQNKPIFYKFRESNTNESSIWESSYIYQLLRVTINRAVGYEIDRTKILWGIGKKGGQGNLAAADYLYSIIRGYFINQHIFRQSTNQTLFLKRFPDKKKDIDKINEEITYRLREEVKNQGAELLYMMIPTKLQIEPETDAEAIERALEVSGFGLDALAFEDELQASLISLFEGAGIEHLSVTDELKELSKAGPVYEETYHVVGEAHEVMAETLYEVVKPKIK